MRKIYFIDLFCGAGGTSTGVHNARFMADQFAEVIACVNHDPIAIASHKANHPNTLHYIEDIRTIDLEPIRLMVEELRRREPECLIILWASLECTNFSKAKGGQARDADSRTLAEHLICSPNEDGNMVPRYIPILKPDAVWIENVEEFMSWGPLDKNGKPISKKSGSDYMRWVNSVKEFGYDFDYRIMNSADYGAYTSRKRYFAQFNKYEVPIVWPTTTHAKKPKNDLFSHKEKWNAVKNCLDFSNEGNSIFIDLVPYTYKKGLQYLTAVTKTKKPTKKVKKKKKETIKKIVLFPAHIQNPVFGMEPKMVIDKKEAKYYDDYVQKFKAEHGEVNFFRYDPYSEKTLDRVDAGLIKYVAGGKKEFLKQYNSGNDKHRCLDLSGPCNAIPTNNRFALVRCSFLSKYYSGDGHNKSIEGPADAITCIDHHSVVNASFLTKYYSGDPENKSSSIEDPSGALRTKDTMSLVNADFLMKYHGKGQNIPSIEDPASTLSTKDRLSKIKPCFLKPTLFLDKTYGGDANHQSIEQPAGTIMPNDKHQLVLVKPYWKVWEEMEQRSTRWIMNTNFGNTGSSIEDPAPVITANRKWHYLMNPQWFGPGGDIEKPSFTLIARMDKAPPHLISVDQGNAIGIEIYESDSPAMRRIKEFMALYGIIDIKMRMLVVRELLKIQGFPDGYILEGTQADQKKFIGNSVVPEVVRAMCEATYSHITKLNAA